MVREVFPEEEVAAEASMRAIVSFTESNTEAEAAGSASVAGFPKRKLVGWRLAVDNVSFVMSAAMVSFGKRTFRDGDPLRSVEA